jgi:hypothetical protein
LRKPLSKKRGRVPQTQLLIGPVVHLAANQEARQALENDVIRGE